MGCLGLAIQPLSALLLLPAEALELEEQLILALNS
jgi:hypothetical protein